MVLSLLKHKLPEKKGEQEKQLLSVRECLNKSMSPVIEDYKSDEHIFSFEFNTPRFSLLSLSDSKLKKMVAVIEGTQIHEEFTFKTSDQYVWRPETQQLYIFTANYQML